jgi:biotin operon repressor
MDETDLVYKGPWVRSAQHRLFQTLETDYAFPRATCRSLVNLIWDFVNETFGEKIHEGQIVFHAASASEPPGKRISEIKTVPIHLTFHDRTDIRVLSEEGTSALRKHKVIRMANEALDQGGLLTQEDLAVLLCSSRRTIRRDIKELKGQGMKFPHAERFRILVQGLHINLKLLRCGLKVTNIPISNARPATPDFPFKGISQDSQK